MYTMGRILEQLNFKLRHFLIAVYTCGTKEGQIGQVGQISKNLAFNPMAATELVYTPNTLRQTPFAGESLGIQQEPPRFS